jgi:hypothetical protein
MFLLSAIAIGAATVVRVEILVADRYRQSAEAFFAADAALQSTLAELRTIADWTPVVAGTVASSLSDGAFTGSKGIPGSGAVEVCCGPQSAAGRLAAETTLAPVPARRSVAWRPFLWTTMNALAPRNPPSRVYVVAWVANDERDPAGSVGDTNHTVIIRAEAIEAAGYRRSVEALVARQPPGTAPPPTPAEEAARLMAVGILRWREVR